MSRPLRTLRFRLAMALCPAVAALLLCFAPPFTPAGSAQEDPAPAAALQPPSVLIESAGGKRILDDFTQMLDLAGPQGARQKRGLLALLDGFLVGLDPNAPIRLEPITESNPTRYRVFMPVADRRKWQRDNLDFASGIPVRELAGEKDTFQLGMVRNAAFDGYMRYYPTEGGPEYAVITEQKADLPKRVSKIGGLLQADQDAALLLRNAAADAAAVERRWKRVAEAEKDLLATLQIKPGETPEEFELRKWGAASQITSGGRFYAESQVIYAGASVPDGAIGAVGTVLFQPLPDTESAEALKRIGETPGRFAGVPFNDKGDYCGRLSFPLTPRQQVQLKGLHERALTLLAARVKAAELPDAQREARMDAFNRLFAIADGVVADGLVELIVDAESTDEGRRVVGAVGIPPETDLRPLLEAFVASRDGHAIEWDAGEAVEVPLHRLTLDPTFVDAVDGLIDVREVWVGASPDAFWYAAGPGAKEKLQSQIEAAAAGGEADPEFLKITAAPSAAVDLLAKFEMTDDTAEYDAFRKIALDVLAGCSGRISGSLRKDEGGIVRGRALAPRCLLTLIGRFIAEISEREKLAG